MCFLCCPHRRDDSVAFGKKEQTQLYSMLYFYTDITKVWKLILLSLPNFFSQSLEKHKVSVFPNLPWSMWLIQAVKKEKKKYITPVTMTRVWANVTWDQFQWIFTTRLCDQPHVGAYSGWNAGWQFGKQSLTSSGRKQKTVSNRLKLENWLWDAALFRLIGPTNIFFCQTFQSFAFKMKLVECLRINNSNIFFIQFLLILSGSLRLQDLHFHKCGSSCCF